jgi:hypothetical protein
MRVVIPATAIGLALAAGAATVAQAQTVITQGPLVTVPAATVVAQPMETVQTTETVRTIQPARAARRQVVTTRTITRRIAPAPTMVARTMPATPQPLYDEVVTAPIADSPQPLYDSVAASAVAPGAVVATEPYIYRYVYEPDRILVIDPTSGVAVQSIPR